MANRWFLGISIPVFLVLSWFNSAISASKGVYFFGGGALLLAVCLFYFARGKTKPLFSLYFLTVLFTLSIACCETVLRLAPDIVRGKAAIYAYNGYHTDLGGIYDNHPTMGWTLRPNCEQRIYWNGHWWDHRTNEDGYRGPKVERAQAIFLGDSMIYGHGVDREDTVPVRFAEQTGLEVANLGQQGTCLIQMWQRLRTLAPKLEPDYVFVCLHPNDGNDATVWYSEEELRRFVEAGVEEDYLPKVRRDRLRVYGPVRRFWNDKIALHLRTARLCRYFLERVRRINKPKEAETESTWFSGIPEDAYINSQFQADAEDTTEAVRVGWKAQRIALEKIKRFCDSHHAQLIVFDLGYPLDFSRNVRLWAQEIGASYIPAGEVVLQQGKQGKPVYLVNDGHWTGTGAELVAGELAKGFERASNHPRALTKEKQ